MNLHPATDPAGRGWPGGPSSGFDVTGDGQEKQTPPAEKVAQAMERKSIYVVRTANESLLEGKQFTGYMAAGPGVPIPISFNGPFRLYRLAKGAGASAAPKSAPKGRRPAKR